MKAAENIFEILNRKPTIDNVSDTGDKIVSKCSEYYQSILFFFIQPNFTGNLKFEDVHFIYPNRPESVILRDFKLDVKSGILYSCPFFL